MIEPISEKEAKKLLKIKEVDDQVYAEEETDKIPLVQITDLPSGFKGYPKGTKISYEPITLGELEALNSGDIDVTRGIAMLLNSIRCNTMKAEDLYYWDVMYIGIQRKLLAFGDTRGVIYDQCPKCGNIVEKVFDYTELEFKQIEVPDLPVITTINDVELEFGILTIKDFLQIDPEQGELGVYARMIKNKSFEEAYELIFKARGKDANKIRYIDEKLNYGIKPFLVKCDGKNEDESDCDNEIRMEVRSPFEVVFPPSQDQGYLEAEIQYGRK